MTFPADLPVRAQAKVLTNIHLGNLMLKWFTANINSLAQAYRLSRNKHIKTARTAISLYWTNNLAMWLNKGRSFARAVLPGRLLLWQAERALKKRTRYLTSSEASLAFALYLMSIKSAHGRWIALDYLVTHSRLMNEYSLMSTLANREVLDHLVEGTLTAYGRLPGEYQASPIPKDYWHYRCFHIEHDDGSVWKISLTDRDNIGEERKATLPEYTELLFNSAEFESQFPMHDLATEVAIRQLLKQASAKGLVVPVLLSK